MAIHLCHSKNILDTNFITKQNSISKLSCKCNAIFASIVIVYLVRRTIKINRMYCANIYNAKVKNR